MAGRRGAVVEDDFYNKLEKINVQAGKKDKILLAHVQRICEAHDTIMRSEYQQIHGRYHWPTHMEFISHGASPGVQSYITIPNDYAIQSESINRCGSKVFKNLRLLTEILLATCDCIRFL